MATYFKNLTIKIYILYVFNKYVKFHVNWISFTIRSTNLFFIHNFRL